MNQLNLLVSKRFENELLEINHDHALLIICWLNKHLMNAAHSRKPGKSLPSALEDVWRYRVGDYRVICKIEQSTLLILALESRHQHFD